MSQTEIDQAIQTLAEEYEEATISGISKEETGPLPDEVKASLFLLEDGFDDQEWAVFTGCTHDCMASDHYHLLSSPHGVENMISVVQTLMEQESGSKGGAPGTHPGNPSP